MQGCFSLLIALLILIFFGVTGFYLWNTSAQAEFEKRGTTAPASPSTPAEN